MQMKKKISSSTDEDYFQQNCVPYYRKDMVLRSIRDLGRQSRLSNPHESIVLPSKFLERPRDLDANTDALTLRTTKRQPRFRNFGTEGRDSYDQSITEESNLIPGKPCAKPMSWETLKITLDSESDEAKSWSSTSMGRFLNDSDLGTSTSQQLPRHKATQRRNQRSGISRFNPFRKSQKNDWFVRKGEATKEIPPSKNVIEMLFFDNETMEFERIKCSFLL